MQGQLATRILNPNQEQNVSASTTAPEITQRKPRFVSGKAFMYAKTRLGLLIGHFLRVIDFTNRLGSAWLVQDLLALTVELHASGHRYRHMARALLRIQNLFPHLEVYLSPLITLLDKANLADDTPLIKVKRESIGVVEQVSRQQRHTEGGGGGGGGKGGTLSGGSVHGAPTSEFLFFLWL